MFVSSPSLRRLLEKYGERNWLGSARASQAALFASQKGGPMTACSMARFLKAIYAEASVAGASSHSGRRTLITRLAERGVDLKAIAQIAGHKHPNDRDVRRGKSDAARPDTAGHDVLMGEGRPPQQPDTIRRLTRERVDSTGRAGLFAPFARTNYEIAQ